MHNAMDPAVKLLEILWAINFERFNHILKDDRA